MQKFCRKCQEDSERYADGRCKVCTLARHAVWAQGNRELVNANSRKWNATNKEQKRQTSTNWNVLNRNRINANRSALRRANPQLEQVKSAARKARKLASGGTLSKGIVERLLAQQQGLCACCAKPLNGVFHLDHIVALSKGGANTDDNVQLLLPVCNLQKFTSSFPDFLLRRQKEDVATKI
jgi:5-methylcytosine-specific restriction endonuclease McrA